MLGEAISSDVQELTADDFAVFFRDKVESVRASTASCRCTTFRTRRHRHWRNGQPLPAMKSLAQHCASPVS